MYKKIYNFFNNITIFCKNNPFWNVNLTSLLFFIMALLFGYGLFLSVEYGTLIFFILWCFIPSLFYWVYKLHPNWF